MYKSGNYIDWSAISRSLDKPLIMRKEQYFALMGIEEKPAQKNKKSGFAGQRLTFNFKLNRSAEDK